MRNWWEALLVLTRFKVQFETCAQTSCVSVVSVGTSLEGRSKSLSDTDCPSLVAEGETVPVSPWIAKITHSTARFIETWLNWVDLGDSIAGQTNRGVKHQQSDAS